MDLVPSHIVPSLTQDREHNDVYSAYNKPGAVMYWLRVSLLQWYIEHNLNSCISHYQHCLQASTEGVTLLKVVFSVMPDICIGRPMYSSR